MQSDIGFHLIPGFIRRWLARREGAQKAEVAAIAEGLRKLYAGEIDHFVLPPGWDLEYRTQCCCQHQCKARAAQSAAEYRGLPRTADAGSDKIGQRLPATGMIAPLAQAENAEARAGESSILPADGNTSEKRGSASRGHPVPPLSFAIYRFKHLFRVRRVGIAAQGERAC